MGYYVITAGRCDLTLPFILSKGVPSNQRTTDPSDKVSLNTKQIICVSTHNITLDKEVIQPQVPLRLPCYDFTPVMNHTVVTAQC